MKKKKRSESAKRTIVERDGGRKSACHRFPPMLPRFLFFTGRKFRLARMRFRAIKAEPTPGKSCSWDFQLHPPPQPPTALGVHLYDAIPRFPYQCIRQLKRLLINCHSARPSGAVGASRGNNRKNARPPTRHSMSGQVKSESESINEYIGIFCQKIFDFSTFHFLVPASVIPVRIILLSLLFGIVVL